MERLRAVFDVLPTDAPSRLETEAVFEAFATSANGLTEVEARRRAEKFGANELTAKRVTGLDVALRQLRSPMVYLLASATAISLALREWIDGLTILVMLTINTGIGFYQEFRSERSLEDLRERLAPRSRVRRENEIRPVDRRTLVPGDVVLLEPGDIVPADTRIIVAHDLTIDESTLTGESIAVKKNVAADRANGVERAANMAYMLTHVVAGYGEGVMVGTAATSVIGKIAKLTEETPRISAFEKNMREFSGFLLKAVLVVLVVVFGVNVGLKGADQLVPQFLFAVALAVSVVPEALPAITSLTLASGALRLAKHHVVVKRLSAIEDLGHIEILCTDKTGTLTQGIMTVDGIVSADVEKCLRWALAVSTEEELKKPSHTPKTFGAALVVKAGPAHVKEALRWKRLWYTPFDPSRRRSTAVIDDGREALLVMLGASEEILARSSARLTVEGDAPLVAADREAEKSAVHQDGLAGRRVLALAVKRVERKAEYGETDERDMTYVGRIPFIDPLKPTAKAALAAAAALNVRVKILTGDSAEVAGSIGLETGIIKRIEDVVSGDTLDVVIGAEFERLVESRSVFARVTPAQKFRIIEALEHHFQVGFLGEGINDAPALKAANVALVVDHASDVARDAADIILLRKDLHVIIDGIRQGRAIFTNIVKYVKYTLVGNFGNFLAISGISLLINDLPMLPVQILLTNLLTDLPLVSIAGDTVDDDEIRRPKRFNLRELAFIGLFLGLVSSFFDFAYFALNRGEGIDAMRTLWFLFSVLTELALIYSIRSRGPFWKAHRPSSSLVGLTLVTAALAWWLTTLPIGHDIFRFVMPTSRQLARVAMLAAAYFAATETVKLTYGKIFKPVPASV